MSALTLAREWNARGIPTVTGVPWRAQTIRNIYLRPRICGLVIYRGEILRDAADNKVCGKWEPILTEDEYKAVFLLWGRSEQPEQSRLGGRGRGYRTRYLLSPFLRCGKCNARLVGGRRTDRVSGEMIEMYRCPANGAGGCGGVTRVAAPVDAYIKALVIAEQQKVQFRKIEDLPPWPQTQELRDLQARIEDSTQRYEAGTYTAERYFPSLARMEAHEAQLKREQRRYEGQRAGSRHTVANLAEEWDKPDFTMEQKQAAIAESLTAVIILPAGRGKSFHPDQIRPIFKE